MTDAISKEAATAVARRIVDANMYVTLATADESAGPGPRPSGTR